MANSRLQEIIAGTKERSKEINKLEKEGLIKKIAPRLYTSNIEEAPEKTIRRNWYRLLSELYPEAFLSHRSALEKMPTQSGHIYLTHSYTDNIVLPGLSIHFQKGHPAIDPDDILFFGNLKSSGLARAYLENLESTRKSGEESKVLTREQLEEKIEAFLRVKGEVALNQVRDRAREIATLLNKEKEWNLLNQLITDMLGTGLSKNIKSPIAKARVLGEPVDPDRLQLFESLYGELAVREYPDYPEKNPSLQSYQNFAFLHIRSYQTGRKCLSSLKMQMIS
jgi:hypothetical protein